MWINGDILLAHHLASVADDIAITHFSRSEPAGRKPDGSLVGAGDLAVDQAVQIILARERPGDGVVTEEAGVVSTGAGRRWLLDPIDGTASYLSGGRAWGTHITLEVNGTPTLAVLTRPTEGLRWWGAAGLGAYRSESDDPLSTRRRLRVSSTSSLHEARVAGLVELGSPVVAAVSTVASWVGDDVSVIGALLDGRVDAVFDDGGDLWDVAPAVVLVTEAGGRFRDPTGGSSPGLRGGLYTNPQLESQLVTLLAAVKSPIGPSLVGGGPDC